MFKNMHPYGPFGSETCASRCSPMLLDVYCPAAALRSLRVATAPLNTSSLTEPRGLPLDSNSFIQSRAATQINSRCWSSNGFNQLRANSSPAPHI